MRVSRILVWTRESVESVLTLVGQCVDEKTDQGKQHQMEEQSRRNGPDGKNNPKANIKEKEAILDGRQPVENDIICLEVSENKITFLKSELNSHNQLSDSQIWLNNSNCNN
jgi:hypothetical protein